MFRDRREDFWIVPSCIHDKSVRTEVVKVLRTEKIVQIGF